MNGRSAYCICSACPVIAISPVSAFGSRGEAFPHGGKLQEKYPEYALIENSHADELFWKNFYQQALVEALQHLPGIDGICPGIRLIAPTGHQRSPTFIKHSAAWVRK